MYEHFFSLRRRPFAAVPDPACWYAHGPFRAALDELLISIERGEGISVLVSPPGTGKTLLCERLIREIGQEFVPAFLRHVTFSTRRSFLQALLAELNEPFEKLTDQELRLHVGGWLKDLYHLGRRLVLVVDEAHLLSEAVLDELRIVADTAYDGQAIVRLLLSGQFGLEEKLAHPSAQAFNHRIRSHVVLPQLTFSEAQDYVDFRITWAGGRTPELFTTEALSLVCQAADGVPRCLNQLCDHALLTAYANEERPVSEAIVRQALDDLSHLPLTWNSTAWRSTKTASNFTPAGTGGDSLGKTTLALSTEASAADTVDLPSVPSSPAGERSVEDVAVEPCDTSLKLVTKHHSQIPAAEQDHDRLPLYHLSTHWHVSEEFGPGASSQAESTSPTGNHAGEPAAAKALSPSVSESAEDDLQELPVLDRYVALDAGLEPPTLPLTEPVQTTLDQPSCFVAEEAGSSKISEAELPLDLSQRIAAVKHVLEAVAEVDDLSCGTVCHQAVTLAAQARSSSCSSSSAEETVLARVDEVQREVETFLGKASSAQESTSHSSSSGAVQKEQPAEHGCLELGVELPQESTPPGPTISSMPTSEASGEVRTYRNLFTLLRRKQQARR